MSEFSQSCLTDVKSKYFFQIMIVSLIIWSNQWTYLIGALVYWKLHSSSTISVSWQVCANRTRCSLHSMANTNVELHSHFNYSTCNSSFHNEAKFVQYFNTKPSCNLSFHNEVKFIGYFNIKPLPNEYSFAVDRNFEDTVKSDKKINHLFLSSKDIQISTQHFFRSQ